MKRVVRTARAIAADLRGSLRIAADARSLLRLAVDMVLYRALAFTKLPRANAQRRVRIRGGVELCYRLNRGDLLVMRETWLLESYRLPFTVKSRVLVDLGANIGLTSVWLAARYGCEQLIAAEPFDENARLLRRNLERNGISGRVFHAAVGPSEGIVRFRPAITHTEGRVVQQRRDSSRAIAVPMVTGGRLLESLDPGQRVDLVKIDIEGGEQALLSGDKRWLNRVDAIIAEFHPSLVDYPGLVALLERNGFRYIPAGSAHPGSMDAFVRDRYPLCTSCS